MITINHGKWVKYTPQPGMEREGAPPTAIYCMRESDNLDWYSFVHGPEPKIQDFKATPQMPTMNSARNRRVSPAINPSSVGAVANAGPEGTWVIGPATYDVDRLFPAGGYFLEIKEYTGSDPQKDLHGMVFDPATGSLTPPVPMARAISRSQIVERLHELNKMTELSTFLNNHLYQKERWYSNQVFKVDDNVLLAMLTEIGADPGVILRP